MRNVPKLRFKEFCGEWEEKKFDEVFSFLQNNTFSRDCLTNEKQDVQNIHYGDILVKYNDILEIDDKIPYIKKENSLEKFNSESYLKTGDIVIADTAEDFTVGKTIEIYNPEQKKVLSGLHTFSCRTNFDFALGYLGQYLNTEKYHSQLIPLITGIKVSSISKNSIKGTKISFPIIKEQQKIADFLSNIDKKISITEEKLDLFKDYKKGIMQKIFKQELRFKDSNGNDYPEWEEKILGNIIIKNKEKNKENKYNLVQSISNKYGFVNQDEYFEDRRVASQDLKNYYVAKNKLFAYNPSRINVGSLAYKEDNNISVISPLYVSFYSNKEYLIDKFLFNWLFSLPFVKQMSCSFEGSVRNNLSFETLSNFTINLPCLEEQQKIANFLSSIDNKIDNLTSELENLKEFKKGLLQQMFV